MSYAYAMIAYMCAFLKVYHPKEFSAALFNSFEGKPEKFERCFKEVKRLKVEFAPFTFRNPSSLCVLDDEGRLVYGLSLVKYCNRQIAYELEKLKDNPYSSFTELAIDMIEKTTIDARQTKVLINLGFFSEFGSNKKLLQQYENIKEGKGIKYDKKYAEKNKVKRIEALLAAETAIDESQFVTDDYYQQMLLEQDFYGYVKSTFKEVDEDTYAIIDINKKYTPRLKLHNLKLGTVTTMKVKKVKFYDDEGMDLLHIGDILKIKKSSMEGKWKYLGKIDGEDKFEQDENDLEPYLDMVTLLQRNREEIA